jgi:serine/threonine-protein kinase
MGIVHRDLKPENIMVLRGTDDEGNARDVVKVCDFGIAKFMALRDAGSVPAAGGHQHVTAQGFIVGTPEYMSPEQGKGEMLDARSDIYSMGVILYHLLTGRLPFEAETALGVVLQHVTEAPRPPRAINALADERLEAICLKAMEKRREDRYQSAREMRTELRAILGGADSRGTPPVGAVATETGPREQAAAIPSVALAQTVAVPQPGSSTETPGATAALAGVDGAPRRGRAVATVAVLALLAGAGGAGAWRLRARAAAHSAAVVPSAAVAAVPPPTTLEPLAVSAPGELPPLETPKPAQGKSPGTATSRTAPAPGGSVTPLPSVPAPSAPSAPSAASGGSPPSPGAIDVTSARVDWTVSAVGGGATAGAVNLALSRVSGLYTQCYRGALQRRNERLEGQAVMRLVTDERGSVTSAHVTGLDAMPHVRQCISLASRVRVEGITEADAWAEVQLVLHVD